MPKTPSSKSEIFAMVVSLENTSANFRFVYPATAITLKSFFDLHELNFVDFLKVDIEGAEILLISEENKSVLSERVRKVALEFHNQEYKKDLTTFFESINFRVYIDADLSMLYALNKKHAKSN